MADEESKPKCGRYSGRKSDHSCPGDHVTWEILLLEDSSCSIECRSELSPSKGGTQAWRVEGTWQVEDEDEIVVAITKEDPLGGPRCDRDVELAVEENVLIFKGARCEWTGPPPDPFFEALAQLSLKELKAKAQGFGLDPTGCVEREEFLELLRRGKAAGALKEVAPPASAPSASPAPSVSAPSVSAPASVPASSPKAEASPDSSPTPAAETETPGVPEEIPAGCYTLEQLTDKRVWEKLDVVSTERETYLPEGTFRELFGMAKEDFAKFPKWKKENLKKKHGLF